MGAYVNALDLGSVYDRLFSQRAFDFNHQYRVGPFLWQGLQFIPFRGQIRTVIFNPVQQLTGNNISVSEKKPGLDNEGLVLVLQAGAERDDFSSVPILVIHFLSGL
jgi:hypothetical protein